VKILSNGKLIAVWGNNSCGKTTTAAQLASQLAEKNQEVLLVLTDITAPDMKVILPHEKNTRSMGNIWSTPDCSIDAIYKACVVTDSDNICLLGYRNSENVFTNPDYTKDNIMDVFMKLKSIVDYVIVDCASEFAYNVLTTVALEMADKVLRLGEATPKAFSFFNSNLTLLLDSRYKSGQHIKVLSKVKSFQPKELAINHYGGIDVELPYAEAIERKIMEGELLKLTSDKGTKAYNAGLIKIMDLLNEPDMIRVKQTVKEKKQTDPVKIDEGRQKRKDTIKKKLKGIIQYD
jgi:MinD-like ATPase involved in chromosome partitioning or flagellar assembly